MKQIYKTLARMQQTIGDGCAIQLALLPAQYDYPRLEITCCWPGGLFYRRVYTHEFLENV